MVGWVGLCLLRLFRGPGRGLPQHERGHGLDPLGAVGHPPPGDPTRPPRRLALVRHRGPAAPQRPRPDRVVHPAPGRAVGRLAPSWAVAPPLPGLGRVRGPGRAGPGRGPTRGHRGVHPAFPAKPGPARRSLRAAILLLALALPELPPPPHVRPSRPGRRLGPPRGLGRRGVRGRAASAPGPVRGPAAGLSGPPLLAGRAGGGQSPRPGPLYPPLSLAVPPRPHLRRLPGPRPLAPVDRVRSGRAGRGGRGARFPAFGPGAVLVPPGHRGRAGPGRYRLPGGLPGPLPQGAHPGPGPDLLRHGRLRHRVAAPSPARGPSRPLAALSMGRPGPGPEPAGLAPCDPLGGVHRGLPRPVAGARTHPTGTGPLLDSS